MKPRKLPTLKYLRECFVYERSTGFLFWRKRPRTHFSLAREWKRWNARYAGTRALNGPRAGVDSGRKGKLDGAYYSAHRVIWKLVTRKEPPSEIDHANRIGDANTWRNIRSATRSQNCFNRRVWGRSGHAGVFQEGNSWRAYINKNGKRFPLGTFDSKEKAIAARRTKAVELYGEFAS